MLLTPRSSGSLTGPFARAVGYVLDLTPLTPSHHEDKRIIKEFLLTVSRSSIIDGMSNVVSPYSSDGVLGYR